MLMIVIQLGLPMLLTAWLWLWPSPNRFALLLQFIGIVAVTAAMWAAGVWTWLPRWSLAIIALLALVAGVGGGQRAARSLRISASRQILVSLTLLIAGGLAIGEAWRARQTPPIASIQLALPLEGNDLMVANGGSRLLLNSHQDTLDLSVPRHRLWQGQSYGVDLVALRSTGMTSTGLRPRNPRYYAIFGRTVRAPCDGAVMAARDGRPDLDVPRVDADVMEGNHIRLRCGNVEVVLAHLQRSSLKVRTGEQVTTGQAIAAVGNSGMSDEPHLHIHAQLPGTAAAPNSGAPVAMFFNGRFLARNDRI
jgi:hypothetical protein